MTAAFVFFAKIGYSIIPFYSRWAAPFIAVDLLIIVYVIYIFIKISHVNCLNGIMGGIMYHLYIGQLHGMLLSVLAPFRSVGPVDIFKLRFILHEHSRICIYVLKSNEQLWNNMIFAFIPFQLLSMIFLSIYLMMDDIPDNFTFYLIVFLLYVLCLFIILIGLSYISELLHKMAKNLVRAQQKLPANNINFKLKYMTFFERLNNENVYGLQIGSIATITFKVTGQVRRNSFFVVCLTIKKYNNYPHFLDLHSVRNLFVVLDNLQEECQCFFKRILFLIRFIFIF